jgi:hypothetical protein
MSNAPGSKPTGGKLPISAKREIPKSMVKRQPLKVSPIITSGVVACFIIAAASAIAPLLFRVSHWWLALSIVALGMAVSALLALRQP